MYYYMIPKGVTDRADWHLNEVRKRLSEPVATRARGEIERAKQPG